MFSLDVKIGFGRPFAHNFLAGLMQQSDDLVLAPGGSVPTEFAYTFSGSRSATTAAIMAERLVRCRSSARRLGLTGAGRGRDVSRGPTWNFVLTSRKVGRYTAQANRPASWPRSDRSGGWWCTPSCGSIE